jgi:hypothetical protein
MAFSATIIFNAKNNISAPVAKMQAAVKGFSKFAVSGFKKVELSSKKLTEKLQGVSSKMMSLKGLLMGMAVVGTLNYLYNLAKASMEANVQFIKFGERVGMTVQQVKEMSYAFQQQGISSDQGMRYMEKFSKTIGQLKLNTGGLTSFLKKNDIGLLNSLKSAKSNIQALDVLADSVKKIHDPMKRAALMSQIFGARGAKMTSLLMGGAEGLKKAREEARKYGGDMAASAEQAKAMHKAQLKLNFAITSVKNTIGASVMPAITALMQKGADWIAQNRKIITSQVKEYVMAFANTLIFLLKHLNVIIPILLSYAGVFVAIKVATVACQAVTLGAAIANGVSATAMAFSTFCGWSNVASLTANNLAFSIYNGMLTVASAVTWLFSAALWSTGIPEIVLAVIALGIGIYELVKHWKEITKWVKTSNNGFAVFLKGVVSLAGQYHLLVSAFHEGGLIKLFKQIGNTIISFVLAPLQLILYIISKITGAKWAKDLSKTIHQIRHNDTFGVNVNPKEKPVNKDVSILTQRKIFETSSKQNVQINIDDATGRSRLGGQLTPIPVRVNNTKNFDYGF